MYIEIETHDELRVMGFVDGSLLTDLITSCYVHVGLIAESFA